MKPRDYCWLAAIAALGAFIWLRDTSWSSDAGDALPILAALPLFAWLGAPWKFVNAPCKISFNDLATVCISLIAGALADLSVLLAIGWTLLLWSWLRSRLAAAQCAIVRRLLILPILAFPWIAREGQPLGWWFRLSAAVSAQALFSGIGFNVAREGTNLLVQGAPVAVAPACAGLGTLQAMLIAGCVPAFFSFGEKGGVKYWTSLFVLLVMSWLANTLRIITIAAAAVSFGSDFAMGPFHDAGGLFVLFAMFCLCCAAFSFARKFAPQNPQSA